MPNMLSRVRPRKILFYLRFMERRGFNADLVLDGTGINPFHLADPYSLVEMSQYIRVINNINRLCPSPSLAFSLGESLRMGDLGILGYCVMSCPNPRVAMLVWHQYNPIFFGSLIEASVITVGNRLQIVHVPYADIRQDLLQFLIEEKICYDLALHRLIGMERFPIERLTLTYPKPHHADCYSASLRCPIAFSCAENAMLVLDNDMDIPLQGHDPETLSHCLKLLKDLWNSVNSGSTMSHKVKAILYENAHRPMTIDEMGAKLFLSSRALKRTLAKEGINFMNLTIAVRLETVKNLLTATLLDSNEIAERVGFSDVRCLRRFFKAHTGQTIQQFKNHNSLPSVSSSASAFSLEA